MASPIQRLYTGQLTGSATMLYTSPPGVWTQILKASACNTDTAARQVTFYIVPNGGSAGASNIVTDAQAILAGSTFNDPNLYGQVLNPGDMIEGFADTTTVVAVTISGVLTTS